MDIPVNSPIGLSAEEENLLEELLSEAHNDDGREILPKNPSSILIDESTSRFSGAEWFGEIQKQHITLAGLGGIGSYVAFLLGRLKVSRLIIYDDDIVDNTNLSGQLFSIDDVGKPKAYCIVEMLKKYASYYSTISSATKFTITTTPTDVMICGFDNMKARKDFYSTWKKYVNNKDINRKKDCLFIDGRLAAEEFQVFCITGADTYLMKKYEEEWLFNDSEAEQTLCSHKQTSFCANMIASVMVNLLVNFAANKCNPLFKRELPFITKYDAGMMYFKTENV